MDNSQPTLNEAETSKSSVSAFEITNQLIRVQPSQRNTPIT